MEIERARNGSRARAVGCDAGEGSHNNIGDIDVFHGKRARCGERTVVLGMARRIRTGTDRDQWRIIAALDRDLDDVVGYRRRGAVVGDTDTIELQQAFALAKMLDLVVTHREGPGDLADGCARGI